MISKSQQETEVFGKTGDPWTPIAYWLGMTTMALLAIVGLMESTFFTSRTEPYISDEAEGVTQWIIASSAIAATLLSVYGVWLLRNTLKATEQTLQQAFVASRASLDMNEIARREQRPYIFVEQLSSNLRETGIQQHGLPETIWKFKIQNFGNTPAIIEAVSDSLGYSVGFPNASYRTIDEDGISEPIRFASQKTSNLILKPSDSHTFNTADTTLFFPYLKQTKRYPDEIENSPINVQGKKLREKIKSDRLQKFMFGEAHLRLFVRVLYRDPFGDWFETRACFRQSWGRPEYSIDGGDEWNFTKQVRPQSLPFPSKNIPLDPVEWFLRG